MYMPKTKFMKWFSLSSAADYMDVSTDTIGRRAVCWQCAPEPGKIRYKLLKLGDGTRMERRYFGEDLEALVVSAKSGFTSTCRDEEELASRNGQRSPTATG